MTFLYENLNEVLQPCKEEVSKQTAHAIIMLTHQPPRHLGASVSTDQGSMDIAKKTIKLRYNNLLIIIWMSHEVVLKQNIASINNVELFNSTIFLG